MTIANDERPAFLWLKRLVWYHAALLVSIHVAASLELVGLIERFSLAGVALVAALLSGIVALRARPAAINLNSSPSGSGDSVPLYLRLAFGAVAVVYLAGVAGRIATFPESVDGNSYHLPGVVTWLQEGSLRLPSPPDWRYSLPANGDAIMAPWLALRPTSLSILPNVAAAVLAALACFCAGERLARDRNSGLAVALVFLSIPMVLFQALANSIDLFCAAFLLAGLALTLRTTEARSEPWSNRRSDVLTAACAVGIAAGSKTTALVYAGPIGLALLLLELRARGGSFTASIRPAASIVLAAAAPCIFWFARATAETGNPLYPLRPPAVLGVDLPGFAPAKITPVDYEQAFIDDAGEWWIHPWRERRKLAVVEVPYAPNFGLGGAFAAFGIVGLLFALYRCGVSWLDRLHGRRTADWPLTWLCTAVIFYLAVWALAMHRVPRFALPAIGLLCVLSAPLIRRLLSGSSGAFSWLFTGAVAAPMVLCFFKIGIGTIAAAQLGGLTNHAGFYGLPPGVASLPPDARLINLGPGAWNFALMGPELSRRVYSPMPNLTETETQEWLDAALPDADFVLTAGGSPLHELVTVRIGPSENAFPPPEHFSTTWNLWRLENRSLESVQATTVP